MQTIEVEQDRESVRARAKLPESIERELTRRVENHALELPILPTIAMEVNTALSAENNDAHMLAELIHRDPPMAAYVLKIANSPFFRPRVPIVSLQQAIARLGATQLRQIVMMMACDTRVFHVPGYHGDVRSVFQHSLATAIFAREIARSKRAKVEEAFLSGLLHDIGRPILIQAVLDIARAAGAAERKKLQSEALLDATTKHHAIAGASLARSWKLPDNVSLAIEYHHDISPPPEALQLVRLVQLADEFARWSLDLECDDELPTTIEDHPALSYLEMYPDDLEELAKCKSLVWEGTGVGG